MRYTSGTGSVGDLDLCLDKSFLTFFLTILQQTIFDAAFQETAKTEPRGFTGSVF